MNTVDITTYDVFRFTDHGHWDLVGEEIPAGGTVEAIEACDQHALDEERYGKFMVARTDDLVVITRTPDDWS